MSCSPPGSPGKRREMDVMKLCAQASPWRRPARGAHAQPKPLALCCAHRMMSDYKVTLADDNPADIYVIFHAPADSARQPWNAPAQILHP